MVFYAQDVLDLNDFGEDSKTYPWESSSFFHPQIIFLFFTGIATYLFSSAGTSLTGPLSSGHISEIETKYVILHDEVLESIGNICSFNIYYCCL